MAAQISVREASAEDAGEIHVLACELADAVGDNHPAPETVRARLKELLGERCARVLVAAGEEGIVGAASVWFKPDLAHGDAVVEVPMLVVARSHRRQGVGRLLVEEIRRLAAENSAGLIELVATRKNAPARAFYHSLGFIETNHVILELSGDLEGSLE